MRKSKQSAQSEEEVYRLRRKRQRDIADVVCRIMDGEGPPPMRDFKPAQTNQTAAEQFDAQHQAAYEARGRRSRDPVEEVRRHNAAHPKMYDELRKRRSTVEVNAVSASESATRKRRNMSRQGRVHEPKRRRKSAKAPRLENTRVLKRRITNKGRTDKTRMYSFTQLFSNTGCQCAIAFQGINKKSGTTEIVMTAEAGPSQNTNGAEAGQRENSGCPSQTSQASKNESIPVNPDTDGSMTSYNSFASFGHEPMV